MAFEINKNSPLRAEIERMLVQWKRRFEGVQFLEVCGRMGTKHGMSGAMRLGQVLLLGTTSLLVKKRSKCRIGNPSLKRHYVQCAQAQGATKKRGSFYRSKYNTLKWRLSQTLLTEREWLI